MILNRCLMLVACTIAAVQQTPAIAAELPMTDDAASAALAEFARNLEDGSIVSGPELVDCKLSGGTATTCFRVTVAPTPTRYSPGPWCPRNISDGPEESGIWVDDGMVYDADGAFIENLAEFYDDPTWHMFDSRTGAVRITDNKAACAAAARPDVDPEYENYCVECLTSHLDEPATMTFVIPLSPVMSQTPARVSEVSGVGVAFNGVRFDAPAPIEAILGAHTLAPFDDCGGHVNLHFGYHYHAATGCTKEVAQPDGHASLIGIAVDGVGLYTRLNEDGTKPQDLDACRGHKSDDLGYHYHVSDAGRNRIIGCFAAELGCALRNPDGVCDATRRPPPPRD